MERLSDTEDVPLKADVAIFATPERAPLDAVASFYG